MRTLAVILTVGILGLVAWLTLTRDDAAPPVPTAIEDGRATPAPSPARPVTAERIPTATEIPAANPTVDEDAAEPQSPEEPSGPSIHIEVWSSRTRQPVQQFRCRIERHDTVEATIHAGSQLTLPRGDHPVTLTFESEDHEPSEPIVVNPDPGGLDHRQRIWLVPAAEHSGITLIVTDPGGAPVPRVLVRATELIAGDQPDSIRKRLWQRESASPTGRYELPGLKPGVYDFAVSTAGDPEAPPWYLPETVRVRFTGSGAPVESVQLRPGCMLRVDVRDQSGTSYGKESVLRLVRPDGSTPGTGWSTLPGVQPPGLRRDGLPGDGPAQLMEPLPAGTYHVQARIGEGPVFEQAVTLSPNALATAIVEIPR